MIVYKADSPEETQEFGESLAEFLEPGMILLLIGDLGAGKTCLAGGILRGLGVDEYVTSPTYTLVNEYQADLEIAHFDLYRLDHPDELIDIGFDEYLDGERLVLIEWPERAGGYLPGEFLEVHLDYLEEGREIRIVPNGQGYEDLCERMKDIVGTGN